MTKGVKVKVKVQPSVVMEAEVARKIRQHARTSMKAEVCGVLLGTTEQDRMVVEACIPGVNAAQGGAHVTFTQDTWEHIYKIKDQQFPDSKIVGWYHSHPGFGVFLSEHDLFIQENFFSSPHQVAWVYDPHTDEEGCFGWVGGKTEKLSSMRFGYSQSVESTASSANECEEDEDGAGHFDQQVRIHSDGAASDREPAWVKWTSRTVAYLAVLALGFVLGYQFLAYRVAPDLEKYGELLRVLQKIELEQHMITGPAPLDSSVPDSQTQPLSPEKAPAKKDNAAGKGANGKH